jgi:predicted ester cyclase
MTSIYHNSPQSRKAEVIVRCYYDELFQAGSLNRAAIERYFAADFEAHDLPPGLRGQAGYAEFVGMLATSFCDLTPIVTCELFSSGEQVAARWCSIGIHCAEFMGIPATGRRVILKGIDLFHLREEKIATLWQEIDLMGILQQITASPRG